jgi:hypothetical protein
MSLPSWAERWRLRATAAVLAAVSAIVILLPTPAHALTPWCLAMTPAMPFADIACDMTVSGVQHAASAISFAQDPLGYLQQHVSASANSALDALLSETTKG